MIWCGVMQRGKTRSGIQTFLQKKRSDIWTGLFREVALYGQERDTAKVAVTKVDDQEIRFTVTDGMPNDWYDFRLTIKIRISSTWDQLDARQGAKSMPVSLIEHEGQKYALVQAVPDCGEVILRSTPAKSIPEKGTEA